MFEPHYVPGDASDLIADRYERLHVLAHWAYRMTYGSRKEIHQEGTIVALAEGDYEGHHLRPPELDNPQIVRVFLSEHELELGEVGLSTLAYVTEEIFAVDRRVVMRPDQEGNEVEEIEWQFDNSVDLDDQLLDRLYHVYCMNYLLDDLADV